MVGRISKHSIMPLNSILEIKLLDVWGIGFMDPFSSSLGNQHILVVVDYVFKRVEVIPSDRGGTNTRKRVFYEINENVYVLMFPRYFRYSIGSTGRIYRDGRR